MKCKLCVKVACNVLKCALLHIHRINSSGDVKRNFYRDDYISINTRLNPRAIKTSVKNLFRNGEQLFYKRSVSLYLLRYLNSHDRTFDFSSGRNRRRWKTTPRDTVGSINPFRSYPASGTIDERRFLWEMISFRPPRPSKRDFASAFSCVRNCAKIENNTEQNTAKIQSVEKSRTSLKFI